MSAPCSHGENTTKCTYVDNTSHFPAVCLVQNGLTMDWLINPQHVAYASD